MLHIQLNKDSGLWSFLCDSPGVGICVLVHEIPSKPEDRNCSDQEWANWYFLNRLNISAYMLESFKGSFTLSNDFMDEVPMAKPEDRERFKKQLNVRLRAAGFTDDQIAMVIGEMCEYAQAAYQQGSVNGMQAGVGYRKHKLTKKGDN